MQIQFTTRYSPVKGQRFDVGAVVDVEQEIALDLIQRGVAQPVRVKTEHAIGPGQTAGGNN